MGTAILIGVVAMNLVTFLAFGFDKWRAKREGRRVPERTLLGLSWATGAIGGWAAMSLFRHKTIKRSFRIRMVAVSILNLGWLLLWWALSGNGDSTTA